MYYNLQYLNRIKVNHLFLLWSSSWVLLLGLLCPFLLSLVSIFHLVHSKNLLTLSRKWEHQWVEVKGGLVIYWLIGTLHTNVVSRYVHFFAVTKWNHHWKHSVQCWLHYSVSTVINMSCILPVLVLRMSMNI